MTEMTYAAGHGMDTVVCRGAVRIEAEADEFFGGPDSRPYRSRVMASPTWGDLMRCAKQQAKKTLDEHHVFVEGIEFVRKDGNVTVIRLCLGS